MVKSLWLLPSDTCTSGPWDHTALISSQHILSLDSDWMDTAMDYTAHSTLLRCLLIFHYLFGFFKTLVLAQPGLGIIIINYSVLPRCQVSYEVLLFISLWYFPYNKDPHRVYEIDPTMAPIFLHEVPETQRSYETYNVTDKMWPSQNLSPGHQFLKSMLFSRNFSDLKTWELDKFFKMTWHDQYGNFIV